MFWNSWVFTCMYTANVYRDLQSLYKEIRVRGFKIYWNCIFLAFPVILKSPRSDFHCNIWREYDFTRVLWGLEWPMLWRITKNSLNNEGTCKWVNWAPIFFWYKLLPTTSRPQKFKKIGVVKVDYFDFAGEVFEKCELDVRVIACSF